MKTIGLLCCLIGISIVARCQEITGSWYGTLRVQGTQLRLVFTVARSTEGYNATMDSPDQGAKGIPVTTTTFDNQTLTFSLQPLKILYKGTMQGDSLVGTFEQNGMPFPLNLTRTQQEKKPLRRVQEPSQPYPYYSEDVTFSNPAAGITLAGTLTLPQRGGRFPVVVLISGSGPQNRNEELLGHKPFLILADYLTRNGIGVLRYDDRGTAQSTGNFKTATSFDFASDVEAAIQYLKTRNDIQPTKIGLVGHSEGGLIAPIVATRSKDVSYIVLLAGPGIPGDQILLMQQELIGRASGSSEAQLQQTKTINQGAFALVKQATNTDSLRQELTRYLTKAEQDIPNHSGQPMDVQIKAQVAQLTSPWMQTFFRYDPAPTLEKVTCPVLALNGEKDLQVPPAVDLAAIRQALEKGGNKHVTTKELPGLNHLFQECTTGSPSEYATIEQTFSPRALSEIGNWIRQQTK